MPKILQYLQCKKLRNVDKLYLCLGICRIIFLYRSEVIGISIARHMDGEVLTDRRLSRIVYAYTSYHFTDACDLQSIKSARI